MEAAITEIRYDNIAQTANMKMKYDTDKIMTNEVRKKKKGRDKIPYSHPER